MCKMVQLNFVAVFFFSSTTIFLAFLFGKLFRPSQIRSDCTHLRTESLVFDYLSGQWRSCSVTPIRKVKKTLNVLDSHTSYGSKNSYLIFCGKRYFILKQHLKVWYQFCNRTSVGLVDLFNLCIRIVRFCIIFPTFINWILPFWMQ